MNVVFGFAKKVHCTSHKVNDGEEEEKEGEATYLHDDDDHSNYGSMNF